MKNFLQEYGTAILACCMTIMMITVASPVSGAISTATTSTVSSFGDKVASDSEGGGMHSVDRALNISGGAGGATPEATADGWMSIRLDKYLTTYGTYSGKFTKGIPAYPLEHIDTVLLEWQDDSALDESLRDQTFFACSYGYGENADTIIGTSGPLFFRRDNTSQKCFQVDLGSVPVSEQCPYAFLGLDYYNSETGNQLDNFFTDPSKVTLKWRNV